jgi:hypothetical protein
MLFIQCPECAVKFEMCCSSDCRDVKNASEPERKLFRLNTNRKFGNSKAYRKSYLLVKNNTFADSISAEEQKTGF